MFLAETIFSLFECPSPPKFDYFDERDPLLKEFVSIIKEEKNQPIAEMENEKVEKRRTRSNPNPRVAILDSDDDENEAENQCDFDSNSQFDVGPNEMHQFAYLRDCIEFLRSEKEDWKKWEAALKIIPKKIEQEALGLDVLAIELLETILFLEDRFNTANFGVNF